MKPTEQEIKDAALAQHDIGHVFNSEYQSFISGANWAISQMQPEWVSIEDGLPKEKPFEA